MGMLDHDQIEVLRSRISALRSLRPIFRRRELTGMIWENLNYGALTEAEMFLLAYDDLTGAEYWSEYLADHLTVDFFAHLISVHSVSRFELKEWKAGVIASLQIVNENLINEGQRPILFPENSDRPDHEAGLKVNTSAAVRELLARRREHLLPDSLVAVFAPRNDRAIPPRHSGLKPKLAKGRPKGTGYHNVDKPIAERALALVEAGNVTSITAGIRSVHPAVNDSELSRIRKRAIEMKKLKKDD